MFFKVDRDYLVPIMLSLLVWILAACTTERTEIPKGVKKTVTLIPYLTPTATQFPEKTLPTIVPDEKPTHTPTPMTYTIVEGDTMLAIAFKHGISLEELQSANPEVNARLLVVGTELIIPAGEIIPSQPVTATPIPLQVVSTNCYPGPDGIWCFISVKNDRLRPLENLSAEVIIGNNNGEVIGQGTAIGAINLLPVGEELPLIVFIPGRFPYNFNVSANILTVQPLPKNDERYLNPWIEIEEVEISEGGVKASVTGKVGLPRKSRPADLTWIFIVAYDDRGNVLGVRKKELRGNFEPGSSQEFVLEVFSMGTEIEDVRAFVEMRP